MSTTDNDLVEACARHAHEINRAYCLAIGDTSQPTWDDAPEWQRSSAHNGVRGALAGNTPEQSHEGWSLEKVTAGWVHGPVKDPDATPPTHPCLVPYAELPPAQRVKDHLFLAAEHGLCDALASFG